MNWATLITELRAEERLHHMNMQSESHSEDHMNMQSEPHSGGHMDHSAEEMSSSGEVPEDLKEAENPTYEVGSKAIIEADHMQGMEGAEATISGAFDTTVYSVSYTPTNGGEPGRRSINGFIHEELENPGEAPL